MSADASKQHSRWKDTVPCAPTTPTTILDIVSHAMTAWHVTQEGAYHVQVRQWLWETLSAIANLKWDKILEECARVLMAFTGITSTNMIVASSALNGVQFVVIKKCCNAYYAGRMLTEATLHLGTVSASPAT